MKLLIICIFFFFFNTCFSQQLLIKIELNNRLKVGYNVEMYFVVNDYEELKNSISNITQLSERGILTAFDCPLVEPGFSLGECESKDQFKKSNLKLIHKPVIMIHEKENLRLSMSISYAFTEYCIFELSDKYWSYDANFKNAAVINSHNKSRKRISKTQLKELNQLLTNDF